MAASTHLAIDLGAGSGRVMSGHFDGRTIRLEEINRFANDGVRLPTGWHWKALQLHADIVKGIAEAHRRHGAAVVSLAVDTWGVDYGLLDARGRLLGTPWMYRDERTDGMIQAAETVVSRREIYGRTGIQFLFFNTLFQLMAEHRGYPETVAAADQLLFMPDLLAFWLSGERVVERTIASTSQMLRAGSAAWDTELVENLGIGSRLLRPVTDPGRVIGSVLPSVREDTGCGSIRVTTCGGHDTASAVAGVPAAESRPLFLSSGTWSLIGRELDAPMVTDASYDAGFSNEQGLEGTTRFLKNIAGMWLLQECKRTWDARGDGADFGTLVAEARGTETSLLIDPDAEAFSRPCDMPAALSAFAEATGQRPPASRAETTRAILQSLALRYREMVGRLRSWMPDLPDTLHIVGGGSQNDLLNQMAADATGLRVMAGPVEATALGNILAQLLAIGEISSLAEGRAIVRASIEPRVFEPRSGTDWEEKAGRFRALTASP